MSDIDRFRNEVREWLEANCPATMQSSIESADDYPWGGRHFEFKSDDQRLWLERMAEKGWTVPRWPGEYGGAGLSGEEAAVLEAELARIGARPALVSFGIWMLGPALLKYGSEAQKREHLPKIARGEIRWCQGYSEPGAGSDLAALKTRADDKGDHFLVNGQKVWTSYADKSDWIFCLVRTDFEAPKHEGISFLLIDMESPGVSTKPIRLISGRSPFCETFFDDVKVPKENLVGEINKGWEIAKYLLTHEREMIGGAGLSAATSRPLAEIAAGYLGRDGKRLANPVLRADIARHEIDEEAFALTLARLTGPESAGKEVGAASSILKFYGTELNKRRYDLLMAAAGEGGLTFDAAGEADSLPRSWLRSRGNSIEGGTSEIQLNIVAKRILNLPG